MSKHINLGDHRRTNENSLVPLETIVELIESDVGPVQREHGGVSFDGTIGTTHIRVTPVDVDAVDGARIANVVSIVTELPELPIPSTDEALAVFNMGAAFSAAISSW